MRGPGEGGEARSDPRAAVAGAVPALLPPAAAPSCGPALPAPRGALRSPVRRGGSEQLPQRGDWRLGWCKEGVTVRVPGSLIVSSNLSPLLSEVSVCSPPDCGLRFNPIANSNLLLEALGGEYPSLYVVSEAQSLEKTSEIPKSNPNPSLSCALTMTPGDTPAGFSNTPRDDDCTTTLGSLCRCITTLSEYERFLIANLNLSWCNLRPLPLILPLVPGRRG